MDRRNLLAKYAHDAWAGWMRYLFTKSVENADGTVTIPKWAVDRWRRQMSTDYEKLPENEKLSDLKEADEIIGIVEKAQINDVDTLIINGLAHKMPFGEKYICYNRISFIAKKSGLLTITYQNALGEGSVVPNQSVQIVGKTVINCFNTSNT